MSYSRRWELIVKRLPRLAKFSITCAWISLRSRPTPDAVVLGSDLEVLAFSALRFMLLRNRTKFVLPGFIYTRRKSAFLNRLRHAYYSIVLRQVSYVICHSTLEVSRYPRMFPTTNAKFIFQYWGGHLVHRDRLLEQGSRSEARLLNQTAYAVAAGRSGRDYPTLFEGWQDVDFNLRIVCDAVAAVPTRMPKGASLVTNCYGEAYLRELAGALFVIIPLVPSDISAGQMVLVQAMALGKACIITRTPTTIDYVEHEQNGLLVDPGDPVQLRHEIIRLITDKPLRDRLGKAALATFEQRHSFASYVSGIVRVARQAELESRGDRGLGGAGLR